MIADIYKMRILLVSLLLLIAGLTACEKSQKPGIIQGTYTGTFERISAEGNSPVSNVQLNFSDGIWNGQTDICKYPALGNGAFQVVDNKLVFSNYGAWTADFDWSLTLSGEFEYSISGDSLTLRKYNGLVKNELNLDIYRLAIVKNDIKQSPVTGTWIESVNKTDTLVFSSEYDGMYPVLNLKRATRIINDQVLPGYFSGPYSYITGQNNISLHWFLAGSSLFNRYYFKIMPGGQTLEMENFFADPDQISLPDTLSFIKIK